MKKQSLTHLTTSQISLFKIALRSLILLCFGISVALPVVVKSQNISPVLDTTFWSVGGDVSTIAKSGNSLFLGGRFSAISPRTGTLARTNASTGDVISGFPRILGAVTAIISDGNGGWYIGGDFTNIGGTPRRCLAHILANNTLDLTFPQMTGGSSQGNVSALVLNGNSLFIAGQYSTIGGQLRRNLSEIDVTTNTLTSWAPQVNGSVSSLVISGGLIYLAGGFIDIDGVNRTSLAAIELSTRQLTSWAPACNNNVLTMLIDGNRMFIGGWFTSVAGQTRNRIAELDITAQTVTSWNPSASNNVNIIRMSGNKLYVGGTFTSISSVSRSGLAEYDLSNMSITSFSPTFSSALVTALSISNNTLYVGGGFIRVNDNPRSYGASFDLSTGNLTNWNPRATRSIQTIVADGSDVLIGGFFTGAGGVVRHLLAALDVTTGMPTSWNPNPTGQSITRLAIYGSQVIVGGNFTIIGGQSRTALASLDVSTGNANALNISMLSNVSITALVVDGNTLYVSGSFTTFGGQPRTRLAAVDLTTNNVSAFNVTGGLGFNASQLLVHNNILYIGGFFTTIGGLTRNRIGSIDLATNQVTNWDPNANGFVNDIVMGPSGLYVMGQFNTIGGETRRAVAQISLSTGLATSFIANTNVNSGITKGVLYNSRLFIAGTHSSINGTPSFHISSLDATTGTPNNWFFSGVQPTPNGVEIFDDVLYIYGGHQTVNGRFTESLTPVKICSAAPTIVANGPTSFCSGGTVELSGPSNHQYLWSNNATTQSITVSSPGTYTLRTIVNGCTSAMSNPLTVVLDPCPNTFIGTGNWTDVSKWSFGTLPVALDSAIVATGSSVVMNTTAIVKSITVAAGATLTMNTTSDLTVTNIANNLGTVANVAGTTGSLRLGGGSFPVEFKGNKWTANRVILLSNAKANADMDIFGGLDLNGQTFNANSKTIALRFGGPGSHTAELLQPAGSAIANATNFRVDKRYPVSLSTIGTNGGAWILVGAPTSNQNVNTWSQGNFYAYSWLNGIYNGSSIYTYDPFYTLPLSKGYKKPSGPTQPAPIGVGHRVWFRYNEFFQGPNQGGQSHSGVPHIGNFTWNLAYCASGCADTLLPNTNTGYNMIANPYAATIDWDAPTGWTRNNVYDAMYIHKSLTQNVASYIAGVGNNGGSRYLPVGQGFFVWANAVGATMTATPQVIVPGVQVAQLRNGQTPDVLRFKVSNGTGIADEAVIRFDQRGTPQFDNQLEARKMSNFSGLNLSFVNASNDRFAIMAENLPLTQTTYPMSLAVPRTGNYTIQFDGMATLTNNWSVFLKDNDLNTLVPVVDGQGYSFNQSAGTTGRFSLVVMPAGPTSIGQQLNPVLTLLPNPATTSVQLNVVNGQFKQVEVVDKLGRTVLTTNTLNGDVLDISTLAAGAYLVKVQTDRGVVTQRLSVIR